MGLEALFTCDICRKGRILFGPKALFYKNVRPWVAIPDFKLGYETSPNGSGIDDFAHEWLCSEKCMNDWVYLSPKHRLLIEEPCYGGWDEVNNCEIMTKELYPAYIVSRTKNYIKICVYNTRFRLSDGQFVSGGYNGRCEATLREEDRLRLLEKR